MVNQLALTEDEQRIELEACETRIFSAFRRGLEATCDIAKELRKIEAQKLYEVRGWINLHRYAERDLRMDNQSVNRCLNVLNVIELLEDAGTALPPNESLLVELARLPDDRVAIVWKRLVQACDKQDVPITTKRVREAVNLDEEEDEPGRPGVKVKLSADEREAYSEDGERALARIRRVCGADIAEAIESGARPIPERSLIRWAELRDQEMKTLVYYVIDQGWTVAEAIAYEGKSVTGNLTLDAMITRARARGGHIAIQREEFLVSVERMTTAAA